MNHIVLIGRLTRDPELRYIAGSGTPVANFSLAVDRDFNGKDGQKQTDFINIEVWNKSAENCSNFLSKGSLVAISGALRIENYENQQGEKRSITKVRANTVQFLDSKNKKAGDNGQSFTPSFNPSSLDPQGFQALDDEDVPF